MSSNSRGAPARVVLCALRWAIGSAMALNLLEIDLDGKIS
jgi:hypothetical protein